MENREVKDIDNVKPRSLRKALEEIRFYLPYMVQYMSLNRGDANSGGYLDKLTGIIDSALSLKQRNCEREECNSIDLATQVFSKETGIEMPEKPTDSAMMLFMNSLCKWLFEEYKGDSENKEEEKMSANDNCRIKPMTLDDAIDHAKEGINESPCGQAHKQLADWLTELREIKRGNFGTCEQIRNVLLDIHEQLEDYVAKKIEETSLCLRIKNIINNALKPKVFEQKTEADLYSVGYVTTMPELAKAANVSPYGGVTGRPRKLRGHLTLLDGKHYYLGNIAVKFDGYGDGLLTEVDMNINASELEEERG